jgi:hypothetical protein
MPFLACMLLILSVDIPVLISVFLVLAIIICGYRFIARYALLRFSDSVCQVEYRQSVFYVTLTCGQLKTVELKPGSLIHPTFSIMTFSDVNQNESNNAVTHTKLSKCSLAQQMTQWLQHRVLKLSTSTSHHVIICGYNASNLREFRRLRVLSTFI